MEINYYKNRSGAVAISLDDGEFVWIPSGRHLPLDTKIWEWTDEEGLEVFLTAPQKFAIEEELAKPPLTEIEQLAQSFHKRHLAVKNDYRAPVEPIRRVLESVLVVVSDPED